MFLATIIQIDGIAVLRITFDGDYKDYYLTDGQAKLLLRQLVEIIAK